MSFQGIVLKRVAPLASLLQYYLNKASYDKTNPDYGTYELADLNYLYGDVPTKPYDGKTAAVDRSRNHLLDIYSPTPFGEEKPEKLPVIISVHGGAYVSNAKECNRPHCMYLASKGYRVVNINYTLMPEGDMGLEMREIAAALNWVAAHADQYGFDVNNAFMVGDSSGGHLVLLYAAVQARADLREYFKVQEPDVKIRATVATCPVGSFLNDNVTSWALRKFIVSGFSREEMTMTSYQGFVDENYPEVAIITTEGDVPIHTESKSVHEYLEFNGIAHEYKSFVGKEHNISHVFNVLYPDFPESIEANAMLLDFFEKHKA